MSVTDVESWDFRKQIIDLKKSIILFPSPDLVDVQSVTPAPPAAVGTKKVDEKAFFDVSKDR